MALPPVKPLDLISDIWANSLIDAVNSVAGQGTAANRPASGTPGQRYYATDTKTLSYYDGTGWVILQEPWQRYTPTIVATGFAFGTGGIQAGAYKRIGTLVAFSIYLKFGSSGFNPGSGNYSVSLPFQCYSLRTDGSGPLMAATLTGYNSSTGASFIGNRIMGGTTSALLQYIGGVPTAVSLNISATTPWTWAAGHEIEASFMASTVLVP